MHFTWDVSAGQVIVSIPIFWVLILFLRFQAALVRFRIEHDDLMVDWCNRQVPPRRLSDLPTRQSKW